MSSLKARNTPAPSRRASEGQGSPTSTAPPPPPPAPVEGPSHPSTASRGGSSTHSSSAGPPGRRIAPHYMDVFVDMPVMDATSAELWARGQAFSNTKRMGYADPRPDIRWARWQLSAKDHSAARLTVADVARSGGGAAGRANSDFSSSLREGLYDSDGGRAKPPPTEASASYSYRHAAGLSQVAGYGTAVDRLTDVRGFTGASRSRFDADGRGRGLGGVETGL